MTRTALAPRLSAHLPEPFVDMHPGDASELGVKPADLVRLRSPLGTAILRARIIDDVQPGQLFVPIHWTGETAPSARIDSLIAGETDPVSGQPESKAAVVAAERVSAAWYGFAVSTMRPTPDCAYWARTRTDSGWRVELAGLTPVADWQDHARALFDLPDANLQIIEDRTRGEARIAFHQDGRLLAALFASRRPVAVMRDHLASLPGRAAAHALTGLRPADQPDAGPVICACFSVGVNTILTAIETQGLTSVEAIGTALQAGTNCGSCKPEIAALLTRLPHKEAAE